jgi:hypothetical protein
VLRPERDIGDFTDRNISKVLLCNGTDWPCSFGWGGSARLEWTVVGIGQSDVRARECILSASCGMFGERRSQLWKVAEFGEIDEVDLLFYILICRVNKWLRMSLC